MYVDNPFKSPAILSLCPGMRGLERGIERVIGPVRTVAYVEIDAFVIENMVQQMEQGVLASAPVWSNVKTFVPIARQLYGKIHGITGGYPCQPFSLAGLRKGEDDPRHLWPFIKRIIKESRPVWCFFENVEGHISDGLECVQKDLHKLGYQVEVGMFSAEEVGAPHRRNRIFILALENSFCKRVRGWSDDERENWRREIQATRSSSMANTGYSRHGSITENRPSLQQTEGPEEFLSGSELENTHSRGLDESGVCQKQQRRTETFISSQAMANGKCQGLEKSGEPSTRQKCTTVERSCDANRWPASPGEEQFDWEPSRVESSLGYVLNGYNFREDLLRMAGNAVVEQTAELAFRDLIRKHEITLHQ